MKKIIISVMLVFIFVFVLGFIPISSLSVSTGLESSFTATKKVSASENEESARWSKKVYSPNCLLSILDTKVVNDEDSNTNAYDTSQTALNSTYNELQTANITTGKINSDNGWRRIIYQSINKNNIPNEPTMISADSAGSRKIQVKWESVSNANGYRIYRRTSNGDWEELANLDSMGNFVVADNDNVYDASSLLPESSSKSESGNTNLESLQKDSESQMVNYVDNTAVSGISYHYTVRAYNVIHNTTFWSTYDPDGVVGLTYCAETPELKSVKSSKTKSILINWRKVSLASGYQVFRKKVGEEWKPLGFSTGTNYTDATVDVGVNYYYTVRVYRIVDKSKYFGDYDSKGMSGVTYNILAPKLTNAFSISDNSIKISWGKSNGETGYMIYRKTAKTNWKMIGESDTNEFTDKNAKKGEIYYYTVKGYLKKGNKVYYGLYDKTGIKTTIYSPSNVKVTKCDSTSTGIRVSWSKCKDADGYMIFRKYPESTGWFTIGQTTSLSFTDTSVFSGITYQYLVEAYNKQGKLMYYSGYDEESQIEGICTNSNGGPSDNSIENQQPLAETDQSYVSWNQQDTKWKNVKVGSWNTMGNAGCAVTSMAMLIKKSGAQVSNDFSPGTLCNKLNNRGDLMSNGYIVWDSFSDYGLEYCNTQYLRGSDYYKKQVITDYVNEGYYIVVKPNSHHYVAVKGVENNKVIIMDPNAKQNKTDLFSAYPSTVQKIVIYKRNRENP